MDQFSSSNQIRQIQYEFNNDESDQLNQPANQEETQNPNFRTLSIQNLDPLPPSEPFISQNQEINFKITPPLQQDILKIDHHNEQIGLISAQTIVKQIMLNKDQCQLQGNQIDVEYEMSLYQETQDRLIGKIEEGIYDTIFLQEPQWSKNSFIPSPEYLLNSSRSTNDTYQSNFYEEESKTSSQTNQANNLPTQTQKAYSKDKTLKKEKVEIDSSSNTQNSSSSDNILSNSIVDPPLNNEISDKVELNLINQIDLFLQEFHEKDINYTLQNIWELNKKDFKFKIIKSSHKQKQSVLQKLNQLLEHFGDLELNKDDFESTSKANNTNLYVLRSLGILYFIIYGQKEYQSRYTANTKQSFTCICGYSCQDSYYFNRHIKYNHQNIDKYYLKLKIDQLKGCPKNKDHDSLIQNLDQEIITLFGLIFDPQYKQK